MQINQITPEIELFLFKGGLGFLPPALSKATFDENSSTNSMAQVMRVCWVNHSPSPLINSTEL